MNMIETILYLNNHWAIPYNFCVSPPKHIFNIPGPYCEKLYRPIRRYISKPKKTKTNES
jgi:hypothetical protein